MANSSPQTIFDAHPRIDLNFEGKILSFSLTEAEHHLGRDPQQPEPRGLKVPVDWALISRCQAVIRKVDKDYYIFDGDGTTPSSNRLFINNSLITPQEGYKLGSYDEIRIGQHNQEYATLLFIDPQAASAKKALKQEAIYLKQGKVVTLGRSETASVQLDSPTVSRQHAVIDMDAKGNYVLTNYSSNGVFVDRQKVTTKAPLKNGSLIQVGPYSFILQKDELVLADDGEYIRLDVDAITKVVKLKNKSSLCLLNNVSLPIEPGQFVAFVGGSGAGKSTMLRALLGIEPTTAGTVYLNGDDLAANFNIYRSLIGYVPQSDIVHTNLRVREVLYYAAKLRLPKDADINQVIDRTLEQVELTARQNTLVKSLSGGQLKRVSIGVELLADPKLFFLDEPTSGLDPGLDKKMMQLLRKLADEGRTVVLVTHATSNITMCDRVAFMGLGGNLCYYGPPAGAMEFFGVETGDFADIYIKLETMDDVMNQSEHYRGSEYHQKYVTDRLSLPQAGRRVATVPPQATKASLIQQSILLIKRYVQLIQRDQVYVALSLLTAPIGILLVYLATKDILEDPKKLLSATNPILHPFDGGMNVSRAALALKTLFVFTCAGIWVGLAASLQEIVKEAPIYLRERLVNLRLFSYVGSKVLTLSGLALLQTVLISIAVLLCFRQPISQQLLPWIVGLPVTTFLTILASISLGLLVSASVKNSAQSNSALPLILLPQIIFSGVLFAVDEGLIKILSWFTIGRWSIGAYGSIVDLNSLTPPDGNSAEIDFSKVGMRPSATYTNEWSNIWLNWGMLLLQSLIYLGITIWLLKRKDLQRSKAKTPSIALPSNPATPPPSTPTPQDPADRLASL
jgi:ABC transport system ATP-binding/permease protein